MNGTHTGKAPRIARGYLAQAGIAAAAVREGIRSDVAPVEISTQCEEELVVEGRTRHCIQVSCIIEIRLTDKLSVLALLAWLRAL